MNIGRLNPWSSARPIPAPKRGPQTHLRSAALSDGSALQFTDWLLLGVVAFAYFISVSSPLFGIQLHLTVLNHFPLAMLGPVMALHMLGISINQSGQRWAPIAAVVWPLVALAIYALIGSGVAKWTLGVEDTYLTFGVYLLLLPLFAASVPGHMARARTFAIGLMAISIFFAFAALVGEVARFGVTGLLHEIEYLVIAGFFFLYYAFRAPTIKILALVLLIASAVVNSKLTGYIIATLAVIYIFVDIGWRRLLPNWRGAYVIFASVLTLAVVCVLTFLYFEFREFLPSGNVNVRSAQYLVAWQEFLASPVWGHAYLAGSGEDFKSGYSLLYIPTHNDVLDILKHGGLIGLTLFVLGYFAIFRVLNRAISATRAEPVWRAFFVGSRFFQITALITFSLNPLLLKGPFLIVIWGTLGMALGLALRVLASKATEKP